MVGGWVYKPQNPPPPPYFPFVKAESVTRPSGILGWADVIEHGVFMPPYFGWGNFIVLRHSRGTGNYANAVYLDGHCEQVRSDTVGNPFLYDPSL